MHCPRFVPRRHFVVSAGHFGRSPRLPARRNGLEASKDFPYAADWNGIRYATKRVRPVFVDEPDEIVVITVSTSFF